MRLAAMLLLCPAAVAAAPARPATPPTSDAAATAGKGGAGPVDIPCGRVEPGVIHVDGLLQDWSDVAPLRVAGTGDDAGEFALSVKCNYDDHFLFLVADVRDDKLVRERHSAVARKGMAAREAATRAAKAARNNGHDAIHGSAGAHFPAEDGVEIAFETASHLVRLLAFPADAQREIPRAVFWDPPRATGVEASDSLQAAGWAVEVKVPLDEVPGWFQGSPQIRLAVAAHDADPGRKGRVLSTGPIEPGRLGVVTFAEAGPQLEAFLRDRKLTGKDIRFNEVGHGTGRVVLASKTLAFVSEDWSYIELPVQTPADILEVKLVDLQGDDADSALVRYRERGTDGSSREILGAYRVTAAGLTRLFGAEVAKSQGINRLQTRVTLVKRGRANDILLEALPAVGWTSATYREAAAQDVIPIPLPWSPETRARYQFRGEEYQQVN